MSTHTIDTRLTRGLVTADALLSYALTTAFTFGNVWAFATDLDVPARWVRPLLGPAVDAAVIGLIIAERFLSVNGVPEERLKRIHWGVRIFVVVMYGLNLGDALCHHQWLLAGTFDLVGPTLLCVWAELGPYTLRLLAEVADKESTAPPPQAEIVSTPLPEILPDVEDLSLVEELDDPGEEVAEVADELTSVPAKPAPLKVSSEVFRGEGLQAEGEAFVDNWIKSGKTRQDNPGSAFDRYMWRLYEDSTKRLKPCTRRHHRGLVRDILDARGL